MEKIIPLFRKGERVLKSPVLPNVRIVNRPKIDPVIGKIAESFKC